MSGGQFPGGAASGSDGGPGDDPTMDDVLASIRRILSEEDRPQAPAGPTAAPANSPDDTLVLNSSMMLPDGPAEHPAVAPAPTDATPALVKPDAAAAAATSIGGLLRTLSADRALKLRQGGPTIEDIVREELRRLLKDWLDAHLAETVERLVRAEIQRVVDRDLP